MAVDIQRIRANKACIAAITNHALQQSPRAVPARVVQLYIGIQAASKSTMGSSYWGAFTPKWGMITPQWGVSMVGCTLHSLACQLMQAFHANIRGAIRGYQWRNILVPLLVVPSMAVRGFQNGLELE